MTKNLDKSFRNYNIEDLEAMLDKLPYQIWLKDKDGKHIYVNKLFADNIGLHKEDIIGKSDYEIRDVNVAKECLYTDKKMLDNKKDIYNLEHSKIDGQDIWNKVHKFIMDRDNGKEEIIGGIAEDISLSTNIQIELESNLLKLLDQNKEDSKKNLHSILKSFKKTLNCENIHIFLYDKDEKAFKLYISENEEEIKFYKKKIYISEEIENKLCLNDFNIDNSMEIYSKILGLEEFNRNGIQENLKIKHISLADKLFGLVCISYNKNIGSISIDESYLEIILNKICIIMKQIENKVEISYIKQKKDELESILKLESIMTDFFANVSHEFRTPVNIILSIVQLLISYADGDNISLDNKKYKEYLNILKQNSYRLLRLVNNIIDTAKISNDFYDLKLENHNIIRVVEDITMSVVRYVNEKNRNIIFDTDQEEVILACDPDKIERIILNLISNAIKFSDCNTDIEININTRLDINKVFVSIKNYGETIDEDNKERIFRKFTQVDDLFIRKNEGSGIGLFLVKKFVEMHNGKIYVDDIEGATQITFYLPIEVIEGGDIYNKIIDENKIIEKCNIEFSDIYT